MEWPKWLIQPNQPIPVIVRSIPDNQLLGRQSVRLTILRQVHSDLADFCPTFYASVFERQEFHKPILGVKTSKFSKFRSDKIWTESTLTERLLNPLVKLLALFISFVWQVLCSNQSEAAWASKRKVERRVYLSANLFLLSSVSFLSICFATYLSDV